MNFEHQTLTRRLDLLLKAIPIVESHYMPSTMIKIDLRHQLIVPTPIGHKVGHINLTNNHKKTIEQSEAVLRQQKMYFKAKIMMAQMERLK